MSSISYVWPVLNIAGHFYTPKILARSIERQTVTGRDTALGDIYQTIVAISHLSYLQQRQALQEVSSKTLARALAGRTGHPHFSKVIEALPYFSHEVQAKILEGYTDEALKCFFLNQVRLRSNFAEAQKFITSLPAKYDDLKKRARKSTEAYGWFYVPPSDMPVDQYNLCYDVGIRLLEVGVRGNTKVSVLAFAGCHHDETVHKLLNHWAASKREVTPNRRSYYIPALIGLLIDATETYRDINTERDIKRYKKLKKTLSIAAMIVTNHHVDLPDELKSRINKLLPETCQL